MKKMYTSEVLWLVLFALTGISASIAASSRQPIVAPLEAFVVSKTSEVLVAELSDLPSTRIVEVGKPLELKLGSSAPGFVSLLYVDSHGVLEVFQPILGSSGNLLDAGAVAYFSGSANEPWQARPPIGQATLFVIASAEPLASLQHKTDSAANHYLVSSQEAPQLVGRLVGELKSRPPGTVDMRKIDLAVQLENNGEYSAKDIVQYFTQTTRSIAKPRLDIHINFAFNSADILPASIKALDTWGRVLGDPLMAGQSFVIGGHTDDVGGEQYNEELSLRRAQAVRDYLMSRYHISSARLNVEGYGKKRPLVDGADDTSRALNRRVDFERTSAVR